MFAHTINCRQVECDVEELQDCDLETDRSHDSGTESEKDYREQKVFEYKICVTQS